MGNPLRDLSTPSELAAAGQLIEITEKIGNFEQLARILETDLQALDPDKLPPGWRDSIVAGKLAFSVVDALGGLAVLDGRVAVTVDMVCQRCVQPVRIPLAAELRLVFADEENSAGEYGDYEVWELQGETLRPADLVEEALTMAMPLAAMHAESTDCSTLQAVEDGPEKTTRPFANLKAQMASED